MRRATVLLAVIAMVAVAIWYTAGRPPLPAAGSIAAVMRRAAGDTTPPATPLPPRGPAACGARCGSERWMVKTLSDPDRERVRLRPVDATIEQLVALPRPARLPARGRVSVERTVWRVEARLRSLFTEDDQDYHLVLESPRDSTVTMIAEVPDPACAGSCASGFASTYARVRQTLADELDKPSRVRKPLIRVTGVGFFDFYHRQRGVARNAIELHPVLSVEFVPDSARR